ncbi:hypothetical protein HpBT014_07810 [Helicobacter pylori]
MNAQEIIQKSALIEKTLKEQGLQERAGPFISENAVIKTEELEKTLKEMQDTDRNLKVGIIGRMKAGKSSLLNALIFEGVEVLPKAATLMTASLTVLKYAQNLSAEVQFYSQKDILEIKNEYARYEKEFQRIVDEKVKEQQEKQKEKQSLANRAKEGFNEGLNKLGKFISKNKSDKEAPKERVLSDEEILEKARKIAKNTLNEDTRLVSLYDQYEKMKKSGLLNTETLDPHIQANSLEELNQKLLQFVGANGKFMPYTKAVGISLNNPNLKDLEVIDTPGVNDPIVSREEHTKALLKDCDVVFIVSPSGQFLTDSDMDLFDMVSNKEGLQEIYFVASQTDSAVCGLSEAAKFNHNLPTALENTQKSLSSSLNATMSLLKKKYPHQQEIFEKAIKNGVILTSGACFSMYKDFKNQASWEKEKDKKAEEYHNTLRNLTNAYPDAFNSVDKSKESLLLLSNMGAIKDRLEKAAQRKEEIISQRLQDYAKSQANNLHNLITQLLQDLEDEKKRIKNADMGTIKKQIEAYEKLSGNIEIGFREAYEEFVFHFIKNIRDGLNETLTKAIQTAKVGTQNEEKEERYTERVKQGGAWGSFKRNFLSWADDAGYDEVMCTRVVVKAGAVVDYLIEMHKICEKALNDRVKSFKIVFKKELYAKVFPVLRQIIPDDDLIDENAFKKSVHAVTDKIKFEEFHYTLPSEIEAQTGILKGYGAVQFIQSVEKHLRDFEAESKNDVKEYCTDLRKNLEKQDFANGVLSKLKKRHAKLKKSSSKQRAIHRSIRRTNQGFKGDSMSVNFFKGIFNDNSRAENHQNNHQVGLKERYDLIARILNARIENEGLAEYQRILDNEFLEFASGVDSLKEKEIALLELQEIKKELQLVASYPSLFQKSMVAVGGGFSAGKSSFLNHLLGLNLKLPDGVEPVTAIPTYCLRGKKEVLMGFSQNGGMVELPHLTFDHKFLNSLGFNLKEIMPFMLLSTPSVPFEFLCFIDTPGYNSSKQGNKERDEQASKESLKHAKHILWFISCERGGIEGDDLEYLQELYEEGRQIFIVVSRADRRTKKQLEEIAIKIKETLEDRGIEFLGIGAYSATRYQEIKEFSEKSPVFDSLEKFLKKLNIKERKTKRNFKRFIQCAFGV